MTERKSREGEKSVGPGDGGGVVARCQGCALFGRPLGRKDPGTTLGEGEGAGAKVGQGKNRRRARGERGCARYNTGNRCPALGSKCAWGPWKAGGGDSSGDQHWEKKKKRHQETTRPLSAYR